MSTFSEKSAQEKVLHCIRTIIKSGNRYPSSLSTRRNREISSNQAYYTKLAVEALPELTPEDRDVINKKKITFTESQRVVNFSDYLKVFDSLQQQQQAKQDQKNLSTTGDQYGELVNTIRDSIQEFLEEQFQKIDSDIKTQRDFIRKKYSSMSQEEFRETYGEKRLSRRPQPDGKDYYMDMSRFDKSSLGVLLRVGDSYLQEFITKAQKSYREKEYHKIDKLVFKLKQRFPELNNFQMTDFSKSIDGIEFVLTADSPQGKVIIDTSTIYAGGYNIQRLHLRWLMHVSSPQGNVDIKQG